MHHPEASARIIGATILASITLAVSLKADAPDPPDVVDVVLRQRVELLERAFLRRDPELLAPFLAEEFTAAGHEGETARTVLGAAMAELRQVESIRLKTIERANGGYRVTVTFRANGLDSEREIRFNRDFEFVEINLFKARILIAWEALSDLPPVEIAGEFKLWNNLIVVGGVDVNARTGDMILDTGTSTLLLNSRLFPPAPHPDDGGKLVGIAGTDGEVQRVWVDAFSWQDLRLGGFEALGVDLSGLESRVGRPVLGIIGQQVFRQYELTIDCPRRTVRLCRIDARGDRLVPPAGGEAGEAGETIAFETAGPLPVVALRVGQETLRLGLDTGAGVVILDEAASRRLDPNCVAAQGRGRLLGAGSREQQARCIRLMGPWVGSRAYREFAAVVTDLTPLRREHEVLDGLMGYEFLRHQRVTINYIRQEIRLYNSPSH
jgi:hypothetical protein